MKYLAVLSVFIMLATGCRSEEQSPVVKEVSSGIVTLRVQAEKVDASRIKVHAEIVNTSGRPIEILHMDPLVGIEVGPRDREPEFVRSFVGIQGQLDSNEAYSYDEDRIIDIRRKDKVLYAQAILSVGEEEKTIDLDIPLHQIR